MNVIARKNPVFWLEWKWTVRIMFFRWVSCQSNRVNQFSVFFWQIHSKTHQLQSRLETAASLWTCKNTSRDLNILSFGKLFLDLWGPATVWSSLRKVLIFETFETFFRPIFFLPIFYLAKISFLLNVQVSYNWVFQIHATLRQSCSFARTTNEPNEQNTENASSVQSRIWRQKPRTHRFKNNQP